MSAAAGVSGAQNRYSKGHGQVPRELLRSAGRATLTDVVVYLAIEGHTRGNRHSAYPGRRTLMELIGRNCESDPNAITRSTNRLERAGWLRKSTRPRSHRSALTEYHLVAKPLGKYLEVPPTALEALADGALSMRLFVELLRWLNSIGDEQGPGYTNDSLAHHQQRYGNRSAVAVRAASKARKELVETGWLADCPRPGAASTTSRGPRLDNPSDDLVEES